jgi:hypothetical protein
MDDVRLDDETERLVQLAMSEHGYDRDEAILAVALEHGETYGAGDLLSIRPLTPEERRLSGLEHDPDQVMAETRARVMARRAALAGAGRQ